MGIFAPALTQRANVVIQFAGTGRSHPLSYWDTNSSSWIIASGTYTVFLGNSSSSLTSVGTLQVPTDEQQ
jgi:hypothetical protein